MPYKDPEKRRINARNYFRRKYRENPELYRQYWKEWAIKNPNKVKESQRKSNAKNKEKRIESSRQWKIKNKLRVSIRQKNYNLIRLYGLSLEKYELMFEHQSGLCLLCGLPNKGSPKLVVDHCHKTGKVRGLLCTKCNTGIGFFDEDIPKLEKAISYLKKHVDT